jgi:hypothetical protein
MVAFFSFWSLVIAFFGILLKEFHRTSITFVAENTPTN